jgi:hypothetical protein
VLKVPGAFAALALLLALGSSSSDAQRTRESSQRSLDIFLR